MNAEELKKYVNDFVLAIRNLSDGYEVIFQNPNGEGIFSEMFKIDNCMGGFYSKEDLTSLQEMLYHIIEYIGILNLSYKPEKQDYNLEINIIDNKTGEKIET